MYLLTRMYLPILKPNCSESLSSPLSIYLVGFYISLQVVPRILLLPSRKLTSIPYLSRQPEVKGTLILNLPTRSGPSAYYVYLTFLLQFRSFVVLYLPSSTKKHFFSPSLSLSSYREEEKRARQVKGLRLTCLQYRQFGYGTYSREKGGETCQRVRKQVSESPEEGGTSISIPQIGIDIDIERIVLLKKDRRERTRAVESIKEVARRIEEEQKKRSQIELDLVLYVAKT